MDRISACAVAYEWSAFRTRILVDTDKTRVPRILCERPQVSPRISDLTFNRIGFLQRLGYEGRT